MRQHVVDIGPGAYRPIAAPLTFVDVPTDSYAQAMLSVHEMGRVELLRDLCI